MYSDPILTNHLQNSSVIKNQSLIIGEWNLNNATNIATIGNYRYRPTEDSSKFFNILSVYDANDTISAYTGATDADVVVDGGILDDGTPITFKSTKEKNSLLFSLEDCFGKNRPRSGINKYLFLDKSIPTTSKYMAQRPRYYFADKDDVFKYWTSYRTENGIERGISDSDLFISDTAPFVVYKEKIPTNKIVIKMQTNVGGVDISNEIGMEDPFFGFEKSTTPSDWKIQKLDANNNWVDLIGFADMPIDIASDGYLELAYGLIIPDEYRDVFIHAGEFASQDSLPEISYNGYAYLIKPAADALGTYAIWLDYVNDYVLFEPQYGWSKNQQTITPQSKFVKNLTGLDSYTNPLNTEEVLHREFEYVYGLRIVVKMMNKPFATFDLIELSPRLCVDLSDRVDQYQISKPASDLGNAGLPVGNLLASTGSLSIFDYDQAFSENNTQSILHGIPSLNVQFKFYEEILDVLDQNGNSYNYYVPIKTMYSEQFPQISIQNRAVSISLRDFYLYFESLTAPQMLISNKPLSYILTVLFDSIGFTNYSFLRLSNEITEIIPYFFVGPDTTIAQVLNDLAISTQSAMFFDEQNNFIVMSKEYMLPSEDERATDIQISGEDNIIAVSKSESNIYNGGKINYTTRYIQKTFGSLAQAGLLDNEKTWIYKPVLLWEVSGSDDLKPTNEEVSQQSSYSLSAIPLNTNLTTDLPQVVSNNITNNIIDFGENIYWIARYSGYLFANGEVIRYDAVEFNVSGIGNVWISNIKDYENYFSKLTFKGKIFPTGKVRIYSEPFYNQDGTLKTGSVSKHGRGQFGTQVVNHPAGISSYWTDPKNLSGCYMDSSYIFDTTKTASTTNAAAGVNPVKSQQTTVSGIIKNLLSTSTVTESITNTLKSTINQPGTIQSSALVLTGPSFDTTEQPNDLISYVYKQLDNKFVHFGTRMRIIGSINNSVDITQTPIGSSPFFDLSTTPLGIVSGAGGGLGVLVNPNTNSGYYFEMDALTNNNVSSYSGSSTINNMFFYKVQKNSAATSSTDKAIPVVLWSGLAPILVDDGKFTGQARMMAEQNPSVYDIAVEYKQNSNNSITFYLYVNEKVVAVVTDNNALPHVNDNNICLFTRGSARMMFENVYALSTNYAQNSSSLIEAPAISKVFAQGDISTTDSFRKYALNGIISSTYLSEISSRQTPDYNLYYDEFGTIMREAAYFNIRYDKAYPALVAKMSPTFNNLKGYTVSGFYQTPYGAEFLVFNNTDTILNLDETTGNYLRIQGVTFTQQNKNELTVDDYFAKISDFSSYKFDGNKLNQAKKDFNDIKNSRLTYGKKEFTLDAPYIQSQDSANNLMKWAIKKVMKSRKTVGIEIFGMPILQLGDIVTLDYTAGGVDELSSSRFVIYSIEYNKDTSGPTMTIYLSEVS